MNPIPTTTGTPYVSFPRNHLSMQNGLLPPPQLNLLDCHLASSSLANVPFTALSPWKPLSSVCSAAAARLSFSASASACLIFMSSLCAAVRSLPCAKNSLAGLSLEFSIP